MKRQPSPIKGDFDKATREWIVEQVGLAGFYEISRIKNLEGEGLATQGHLLPVELAAVLSVIRTQDGGHSIAPFNRAEFETVLDSAKRARKINMEGESLIAFESESSRRLSKYSKLFKTFPGSLALGDFDMRVFSSLYEKLRRSYGGGQIGKLFFQKLVGETERGHELTVYLFSDDAGLVAKAPFHAVSDPSIPKRIFVKEGHGIVEKDSMLASAGLLYPRKLKIVQHGVVMAHK
jgi:hypothetical protein